MQGPPDQAGAQPVRPKGNLANTLGVHSQLPAGLRNAVEIYWQQCDNIAQTLVTVLLQQVEVDTAFIPGAFEKPLTNMTLLHYPATPENDSIVGTHPHKDTDVLTILAPDAVGGLEIRPRSSKQWVAAVAPANRLIINIGDMLGQWSGGYYISTPHSVINRSGQDRYSYPCFAVPRHDVVVTPLCNLQKGFVPVPMHCAKCRARSGKATGRTRHRSRRATIQQ